MALLISIASPVGCQAGPNLFSVNVWNQNRLTAFSRSSSLGTDTFVMRTSTLDYTQAIDTRNVVSEPVAGTLIGKPVVKFHRARRTVSLQPVFGSVNGLQFAMGF